MQTADARGYGSYRCPFANPLASIDNARAFPEDHQVLSFEMQNGELLDRVLAGLGGIAWARCATASWTGSRGAASAAPSWNWTPRNLPGRAAGAVAAGRHRLLARYRDHDAFATQILSPRAAELVVLFLLVADLFTMSHVCDVEE
jgi:hypothetical protein